MNTAGDFAGLLTFSTTFRVMRADQVLADAGVAHGLAPVPAQIKSGCGLAVQLPAERIAAARRLLAAAAVPLAGAFRRNAAGEWTAAAAPPAADPSF